MGVGNDDDERDVVVIQSVKKVRSIASATKRATEKLILAMMMIDYYSAPAVISHVEDDLFGDIDPSVRDLVDWVEVSALGSVEGGMVKL